MYDKQYYFCPNPLDKLTVSARGVPQTNWLPAPRAISSCACGYTGRGQLHPRSYAQQPIVGSSASEDEDLLSTVDRSSPDYPAVSCVRSTSAVVAQVLPRYSHRDTVIGARRLFGFLP
jgi:hypothetical protein